MDLNNLGGLSRPLGNNHCHLPALHGGPVLHDDVISQIHKEFLQNKGGGGLASEIRHLSLGNHDRIK